MILQRDQKNQVNNRTAGYWLKNKVKVWQSSRKLKTTKWRHDGAAEGRNNEIKVCQNSRDKNRI